VPRSRNAQAKVEEIAATDGVKEAADTIAAKEGAGSTTLEYVLSGVGAAIHTVTGIDPINADKIPVEEADGKIAGEVPPVLTTTNTLAPAPTSSLPEHVQAHPKPESTPAVEPVAAAEPTTKAVAPVEPVVPVEPVAPIEPVAPVEPAAPVEPIAAPVEPVTASAEEVTPAPVSNLVASTPAPEADASTEASPTETSRPPTPTKPNTKIDTSGLNAKSVPVTPVNKSTLLPSEAESAPATPVSASGKKRHSLFGKIKNALFSTGRKETDSP